MSAFPEWIKPGIITHAFLPPIGNGKYGPTYWLVKVMALHPGTGRGRRNVPMISVSWPGSLRNVSYEDMYSELYYDEGHFEPRETLRMRLFDPAGRIQLRELEELDERLKKLGEEYIALEEKEKQDLQDKKKKNDSNTDESGKNI